MARAPKIDVIAACIAAELFHAAKLAKGVSLTAKNARAISLRAGERSVGFKAITVFINEFADNTIEQANKINDLAVSITRLSINRSHVQAVSSRFERAWSLAGEGSHRDCLLPISGQLRERSEDTKDSMCALLRQLKFELDESVMQIRAAGIIATTSKTEAAGAGEYKESLNVIANTIEESASEIRTHLRVASSHLRELEAESI